MRSLIAIFILLGFCGEAVAGFDELGFQQFMTLVKSKEAARNMGASLVESDETDDYGYSSYDLVKDEKSIGDLTFCRNYLIYFTHTVEGGFRSFVELAEKYKSEGFRVSGQDTSMNVIDGTSRHILQSLFEDPIGHPSYSIQLRLYDSDSESDETELTVQFNSAINMCPD